MRITEMKLAGRLNKNNLPEYFATIHRVPDSDYLTVTIIGPGGEKEHIVEADCADDCTEDEHSDTCPYIYEDNDFVMRGWAMVDVIRRVLLPLGWREPEFEKWEVPA